MSEPLSSRLPIQAWFLVGATAVGKSAVAQRLAEPCGAAILSADAMLVYRGMDIGTAKPLPAERGRVRYFGLDLAAPDEPFSTGAWLARVRADVAAAGLRPAPAGAPAGRGPGADDLIVAGGTGLYVRALAQGLDAPPADPGRRSYWQERLAREGVGALYRELQACAPRAAAALADPANPRRVIRSLEQAEARGAPSAAWRAAPRPRAVGLRLPRAALHARIARRVEQMFADGLADEVAALRARYPAWRAASEPGGGAAETPTARQAIGYAEVCALLDRRITPAQARERIATRTRQLAKRQETWFRHQADVTWIEVAPEEPVAEIAARVLTAWREHGPTPIRL